jgi:7-cyano-7-deazaguanine synthase in queuosine biosynthesis
MTIKNIHEMIHDNKIYRFSSELQYYNNQQVSTEEINKRNQNLLILSNQIFKGSIKEVSQTEKLNNTMNQVNTLMLKRPFYKLNNVHKKNIITAYLKKRLNSYSDNKIDSVCNKIIIMNSNKELTTKHFDYNKEESRLLDIKDIIINDEDVTIEVKKKKTIKPKVDKKIKSETD